MKAIFLIIMASLLLTACRQDELGNMTINDAFDTKTAAFVGAVHDHDFIKADILLSQGVDINAVGVEGITPLLWVMLTDRNATSIAFMLKRQADPNYVVPNRMVSAMYFATGGNRKDLLELILQYGGNPSLIGPDNESMLMIAITQRREEYFDLLIKHGADINWHNKHGHSAAWQTLTPGRFDWTFYFLEKGYDADLQSLASSVETRPASDDMQRWKEKVIDLLKEKGAKFPAGPRVKNYIDKHRITEKNVIDDLIYGRQPTLN
ncbi:MAG: ankyrin repeat domain-containing protein [Pseudomonadaceae bacterium]